MNRAPRDMSPLIRNEKDLFTTEFPLLSGETIQTAQVALILEIGADANPQSMLVGTPQISGSRVSFTLYPQIAGNIYICRIGIETSTGRLLANDLRFEVLQ